MSQDNDLSAYEKLRLENIRRNAEFLFSMGIQPLASKQSHSLARAKSLPATSNDIKAGGLKRIRTQRSKFEVEEHPTRRSKRRLSLPVDGIKLENDDEELDDQKIPEYKHIVQTYQDMPMESLDLDDSEFQVFVALRAWRLRKCRELDVEPYKILQNRTLAEIIRRRRNDASWANCNEDAEKTAKDLLQCWGIGPAKATSGSFGWEVIDFINQNSEILALLEESRKRRDNFPVSPDSR